MITMFLPPDRTDFDRFSSFMIDILTSRPLLTAIITLIASTCHAKIYDLAILGDSISAGYGVKQHENWVNIVNKSIPCPHTQVNLSADDTIKDEKNND